MARVTHTPQAFLAVKLAILKELLAVEADVGTRRFSAIEGFPRPGTVAVVGSHEGLIEQRGHVGVSELHTRGHHALRHRLRG